MSTQENPVPSHVAQFFIELSQNIDKQEQFRQHPIPFLEEYGFRSEEIDALLSRDPQTVRSIFHLDGGGSGLGFDEGQIREIVRDEIEKSKRPAKKKKKPAPKKKDKGPAKK